MKTLWRPLHEILIVLLIISGGCATRTPEEPSGDRGTYEPPTSPLIVVDNLRNAVIEKNTQNFMLSLADPSRSSMTYAYEPSAEVGARYQAVFSSWNADRERQAFLSMISRLPVDQRPSLVFSNTQVAFSSPDSLVWVSDYELTVRLNITALPSLLTGTMALTVTPERSGLWSVSRWRDAKRPGDTVESTWSLLRGQLSN
ncbi:MAG: hypothetical protein FGM33_03450 [Candidatus Kapabacteria bacterium]|nr:hypothetical protein [Candidatus Kapabacteria bacterium]